MTMYAAPPKKLLILNILDILNKYTDAEHRLSQKQIEQKLEKEYTMSQAPDCHIVLYPVIGFSCPCFCPYELPGRR